METLNAQQPRRASTRVGARGLARYVATPLIWFAPVGSIACLVLFVNPFSMAGVAALNVLQLGGALTGVLMLAHSVAGLLLPRVFTAPRNASGLVRWIEAGLAAHGALLLFVQFNPFEQLRPLPDRALLVLGGLCCAALVATAVRIAVKLRPLLRLWNGATSGQISR